jgi:hypothetical protein
MKHLMPLLAVLVLNNVALNAASAADELTAMLDRVMAFDITPTADYTAKVIVPPGQLYDPLVMHRKGEAVWLNDDGKEHKDTGSRMLAVARDGQVSVLVDADKLAPISAGFDIAPPDFGAYGGQIFALSQPKIGDKGGLENYIVQRIDPRNDFAVSIFCTLPGLDAKRPSAIGVDVSFGPPDSPFAGKLYASTTLNGTIYEISPQGRCEPFVTLDAARHGGPLYMRFALDGQSLLVSVVRGGIFAANGTAILRVRPDGSIDDKAVAEGETMFGALDFAPAEFGQYGGDLFVVEVGYYEIPVPLGQALRADGKVHRVTADGKLELVASGFINPWGIRFFGDKMWISDINGDFIYGKRELPDGFIVEIAPR